MKRFTLLFVFVLTAHLLFAWGPNGHRIVAQICYDNLSANARAKINRILGNNYMAQIATWPDFIRSEKNWDFTKNWHFITVDSGSTFKQVWESSSMDPAINNVAEAIDLMESILKNDAQAIRKFRLLMDSNHVKPLEGSIITTALAFLIHFMGDLHQPMHVGKGDDFGGNKVKVIFFSKESNLHSVWDEGIIEQEQLCFQEFSSFVQKHFLPQRKHFQKGTIDQWGEESITAREGIYSTLYNNKDKKTGLPGFSYQYQHDNIETIEGRLAAAGYRAASILNAIFK